MSQLSRTWTGLMCGLMLASTGCATLNIPFVTDRVPKATARNPVTQIVCIWQPSEGRDPNGMPCRGFAGQILFLANRGSLPVQVEGDVRIYLFDDHGTVEDQAKPLHLYNFDSKSWGIHLTKGTLGPTYSVFVPYTRRGNYEAKCALRVRMTGPNGETVFSDLASIQLDGKKNSEDASDNDNENDLATEAKAATEAVSKAMRRTTTISMSGETAKQKSGRAQTDTPATVNEDPSGRVQLANYEVGRTAGDPSEQRVEQLEQLVQLLLEQQREISQNGRTDDSPPHGASAQLDKPLEPQRHRLTQRPGDEVPANDTRTSKRAESFHDNSTAQDIRLPPHPLTPEARIPHPLNDDESTVRSQSQHTAVHPRREPASNHPLAAFDAELSREESVRKLPRKSPAQPIVKSREDPAPSTHPLRAVEQTERTWNDPFDPISTEAIKTTSVAPETILRQRLRAAR